MSVHNFTRTLSEGFWDTNVHTLSKEVKADLPGKMFTAATNSTTTVFTFTPDLSAPDTATLVATVATHQGASQGLIQAKKEKNQTINAKTQALIFLGFEHPVASGQMFSLSIHAQRNLTSAKIDRDNAALAYPLVVPTINDLIQLALVNDAAFDLFYAAGNTARRGHLDTGNVLKAAVISAVDIAAVLAIVDNR